MKIKKIVTSLLVVFLSIGLQVWSQSKADDLSRLKLAPVILPQASAIPSEANALLIDKMNQIVSSNGLTANANNSRFIITPNISVLSKEIIGGAPILYSIKIQVSFYVGDGNSGTKFSSAAIESIGTGTSENKAYIQAFNKINTSDTKIVEAINIGKLKIIEYYTVNCDLLIKQATAMAQKRNYDEAIYNLISIPDACGSCYNKAIDAIKPIFNEKINYECGVYLNMASNTWNANQTYSGAQEAGNYLSKIDPGAACYPQAEALRNTIRDKVTEIDKREWNYKWEKEIGITKDLIKAYRDIGVAWGENQPQTITTTYNVIWW